VLLINTIIHKKHIDKRKLLPTRHNRLKRANIAIKRQQQQCRRKHNGSRQRNTTNHLHSLLQHLHPTSIQHRAGANHPGAQSHPLVLHPPLHAHFQHEQSQPRALSLLGLGLGLDGSDHSNQSLPDSRFSKRPQNHVDIVFAIVERVQLNERFDGFDLFIFGVHIEEPRYQGTKVLLLYYYHARYLAPAHHYTILFVVYLLLGD
jgi:hypothetical protein